MGAAVVVLTVDGTAHDNALLQQHGSCHRQGGEETNDHVDRSHETRFLLTNKGRIIAIRTAHSLMDFCLLRLPPAKHFVPRAALMHMSGCVALSMPVRW